MTDHVDFDSSASDPRVSRLLAALDLMELGIEMMRQNIARRSPGASREAVNAELQAWIENAPRRRQTEDPA